MKILAPLIALRLSSSRACLTTMRDFSFPATGKIISTDKPLVSVLAYHHLGIAVTDVARSREFFAKIGFTQVSEKGKVVILRNPGGLFLHTFPADRAVEDGKNLLMDFPDKKYPGHTHVSFMVPSVAAARAFLEGHGFEITGERAPGGKVVAVFIRDPDRTTFEFEKNLGGDKEMSEPFTPEMVGNSRPMDHVGIRVRDPEARLEWYAEKLGFFREVFKYQPDPDVLKNGRPWITTTPTDCDINRRNDAGRWQFIINANTDPAEPNILTAGGETRPGIVFVAFTVANVAAAAAALNAAGVPTARDAEVTPAAWGLSPESVAPAGRDSVFLRDPDGNLLRLVEAE